MAVYVWRSLDGDVREGIHLLGCETLVIEAAGKALLSTVGHSPAPFLAVQFCISTFALHPVFCILHWVDLSSVQW